MHRVFPWVGLVFLGLVPRPSTADDATATITTDGQWQELFANGLTGWTVDARDGDREEHRKKWALEDGVLHNAGGGFGFLRYDEELGDFEFQGEYRLPERGNSGIGIRSVQFTGPSLTRPSFAAYELQLV